jgi:hypothetical protein
MSWLLGRRITLAAGRCRNRADQDRETSRLVSGARGARTTGVSRSYHWQGRHQGLRMKPMTTPTGGPAMQAAQPGRYSIGHSNIALEDPLSLLKSHHIEVVADVRTSPRSRYVPHLRGDGRIQTEDDLDSPEAGAGPQETLFEADLEERRWRSAQSVSRRRAPLNSSAH